MKIIEEAEVRRLLTPERCLDAMRTCLVDLEEGRCAHAPAPDLRHAEHGDAGLYARVCG